MKLIQLKNILSANRCIVYIGKEEIQYRGYELLKMFNEFGDYEVLTIQSFQSQDNAMEIILENV